MKKPPRDIIILHMCIINDNHTVYGPWDMEHDGQNFLSFWTIFCTFTPLITWKIKISKKIEKTPRDIITLHMCTINDNHMMYGSWNMEHDGQNYILSFWTIFCTFAPLTTWKIKILKKWKNHLEILSLYTCVPQMTITWCMVPEILSATDRTFCHFGPFFALLPPPPKQPKKSKFWNNENKTWRYYHFTQVYHKWQSYDIWFLRYKAWWKEFFCHFGWFFALLPH